MNEFLRFFRWGLHTKYHMGVYSAGILFFKSILDYFCGIYTTGNLMIFQAIVVCMVISLAEGFLFPEDKILERSSLIRRTPVWILLINILLIGSALLFNWFPDRPLWYYITLIAILEISLPLMWVGIHIAERLDSHFLNKGLQKYQS